MRAIIESFIKNRLFFYLGTSFVFLAGIVSLLGLRRDTFPNVDMKQLVITTKFPGAAPADVELRVTYPIEEKIKEIDGIDEIRSFSRNSASDIDVRVSLEEKDPEKILDEIRRAVDNAISEFPPQVTEKPKIIERKSSSYPVLEFSVFGGKDEIELHTTAEFLERELEKISGVARVDVFGKRDREWQILVNANRLKQYQLDLSDITTAIRNRNVNLPAGSVDSETAFDLRIDGEFRNPSDIYKIPIRTNDLFSKVELGSLARVEDTFEYPRFLAIANGKQGLILSVVKKERADAIDVADHVRKRLAELKKTAPPEIKTVTLSDEAKRTSKRLDIVSNNALIGFCIVFGILFLFLDFRTATITSLSLPISMLMTFAVLPFFDVSFNMISMMGLIIALGMLVDNSIVISENIYTYLGKNMDSFTASVKGTLEMLVPIFGSYLTTVAAFLPMLFMSGIMGKFVWQIPLVVIVALTASLIESFLFLPARITAFAKTPDQLKRTTGFRKTLDAFFHRMEERFSDFVAFTLHHKYSSFVIILILILASFVALSRMKFILFPKEDIEIFTVKAEFPSSFRIYQTREKMKYMETIIQSIPPDELVSYSIKIGVQQTDPEDPLSRYGENLGVILVYLTPESERKRKAGEILASLESDFRKTPSLVDVYMEEFGAAPPIGAPITVSILGKDYKDLTKVSGELQTFLKTIPGVHSVRDDYRYGRKQLQVRLDEGLESFTGVSTFAAANMLRTAYDGERAGTVRKGRTKIYLRVVYDKDFRKNPDEIKHIPLRNKAGNITHLSKISKMELVDSPELLSHREFERAITVNAEIKIDQITAHEANSKIIEVFKPLIERQYPGVSLVFGGEEKDTQRSMESLGKAGLLALFGIFAILALTMQNFWKPFLILSTIPLGIMGIVLGFPLSGKSISFLAMIGIIGLAGVLVNASIVLVDCIDSIQKGSSDSMDEILLEASRRRFRPILLTTLTTVAGILPTAYGLGGTDPVLVPMTLALGWGLGFGTFGSLLYVPVTLSVFHRFASKQSRRKTGH
ncbi:RND transporter, Hydrophobe/Amphiphile Efflux-1 (HAE1)/Heavy Metal Efflux (HME) family, permease protein [Leptospira inadai serovar Lyme str. 10]|uniref:RND transporter, Hydrophobe/Amphiphile Efflux-1 (HAE1)/Heavy Metal Efflux (HME) family, permease protein n=2 Tax=Leptospira inadai serovar Lyme TaxID=293084 RepID=V6HCV6_9LEPT|nr:efflux RND transporter permease subunit [Leptospira inadai]EQA36783.1 RND transporter, Hydrophobe/Amphiphile Efflux-1 (HAE1)/Heavy Metal Efflux (HME) family, permease protein [Leptospira inadai serovar Lyme str. 10]PNV75489.1 acriflavin resistance protein [Leptospira inadai serovar Lyme]